MSKITEHVGNRIRKCRKRKGYTIEEFSKMINKSKATLSKYENGTIAIDIDTLLDIAEALEMELTHLINYSSLKANRQLTNADTYFDQSYYYIYYYDGRHKRLIKSIMTLSTDEKVKHSSEVIFYKGVDDFNNKEDCDNIYNGTIDSFDATTHATLINQINKSERIHFLLMNPMQRGIPAIGILSGIGNPPYFAPVAIKVIVSKYMLDEDDPIFENIITITKDELKQYKQYNMMIIGNDNYQNIPTK